METAREYWKTADIKALAQHWNYNKKTPYEVAKLVPLLHDSKFIWDAACGDYRVTSFIEQLFPFRFSFLCTDITQWDLSNGLNPKAEKADTVLLLGVIKYLSDEALKRLLSELAGKKVIVREPCGEDKYINGFSCELNANYEAYCRSKKTIMEIMTFTHRVGDLGNIYPPALESRFGGEQRMFIGEPCQ